MEDRREAPAKTGGVTTDRSKGRDMAQRKTGTGRQGDSAVLAKILERLRSIDPPIKRVAVDPPDPAMAIQLVDLSRVCYFTTRADAGREETAVVMVGGETRYTAASLDSLQTKLAVHPHFMRTSRYYLVNLTNIRAYKESSAKDLWFNGIEEAVKNGVTATHKDEFEAWLGG